VSAPSSPAVSIGLDSLPTVIALPLREYLDEANPVLKLWYACDSVEMLLRLVVMMGLAALGQRGPLTLQLRKQLQEYRLEEPTLGNWRAMAEAVVEALGAAPNTLPELPGLVRDTLAPLLHGPGKGERDESNSFIRLRNRLAHGGGISRALAQRLEEIWQPRLWAILEQLTWLTTVDLVVRDEQGGYGVLRGPNPEAQPYSPRDPIALAQTFVAGDAVVLVRGEVVLPLWPLALYGAPRSPNPDAPSVDEIVPQVYLRRGEVRLQYTPLGALAVGSSESEAAALECFVDWFKVTEESRSRPERQFQVRDFTAELRKDGLRVLGRADECKTLNDAVAERTEGVIWVSGVAGIGKSYVFAWLALRLLDEPPPDTLVLPYRFRAGDERCSREVFLRFAVERLAAWLEIEVETDSTPWLKRLRGLLGQLAGRRVVFLLDGLDEIAARDARFAQEVPLALMGPGILWVCAGRPDYDLPMVFAAGAHQPFPDGLPKMDAGDIRTLLLERIGPLRKYLLRHDQEQGERIGNPFVEKVAQAAAGVPLYVKYVINDIFAGRYRVLDGHERLPPSLSAYYEELLRRLSVGDLHQVLTPLAATLAVALEPLDATALAALLRRRGKLVPEGEKGLRLVEQGLSAIASMLKRALTPEGQDGYTLYHLSLRQHMASSEHSQVAVATAREVMGDLALDVAPDTAAPYLYRCGITHLLEMHRAEKALGLLTQFEYLIDRLRTLTDSEDVEELGEDWRATVRHAGPLDREQRLWEAFWREREHILRRGDHRWPAYKILLQLAVEHADDSPVTRQAEDWLAKGKCDWIWLRNPQRIKHAIPSPCLRIFEAQLRQNEPYLSWVSREIMGKFNIKETELGDLSENFSEIFLTDDRILSWGYLDNTLRIWSNKDQIELAVLSGHTNTVSSAKELIDGRILSWSRDNTLRLWHGLSGEKLFKFGECSYIHQVLVLMDQRILVIDSDKGLTLWDIKNGPPQLIIKQREDIGLIIHAIELSDGCILSWTQFNHFLVLDLKNYKILSAMMSYADQLDMGEPNLGHITGSIELRSNRILSWYPLRIWDRISGVELMVFPTEGGGALELENGHILTWEYFIYDIRVWDGITGKELTRMVGHTGRILGVIAIRNRRILSWSEDGTLRLWNESSGDELAILGTYFRQLLYIQKAVELLNGLILTISRDQQVQLWDVTSGIVSAVLPGHDSFVREIAVSIDKRVLSWAPFYRKNSLRLWNGENGAELAVLVNTKDTGLNKFTLLSSGHILSWFDNSLRLWDGISGTELAVLVSHNNQIKGVLELADGCILSWSDYSLWLWDGVSGIALEGKGGVTLSLSGVKQLADGRILTWSESGIFYLWNKKNMSLLTDMVGHTGAIVSAIEMMDGRILSWSEDHTLRLWSRTGRPLGVLMGHTAPISEVIILQEGIIISYSEDDTLRLWDETSGTALAVFEHVGIRGVKKLLGGRILSWSSGMLKIIDVRNAVSLLEYRALDEGVEHIETLLNGTILVYDYNYWLNHKCWRVLDGSRLEQLEYMHLNMDSPWLEIYWLFEKNKIINKCTQLPYLNDSSYWKIITHFNFENSSMLVQNQFVGWSLSQKKICGIKNLNISESEITIWYADSRLLAKFLLEDGTLVVTLDSGHVFFLKLHHGGRRISLAEWHDLPQTDV
jgi:WD40 repeat protein